MISYLTYNRSPLFWLAFHAILGLVSTLSPWPFIVWFYLILLTSIYKLLRSRDNSFVPLVFLISYATSFELPARMAETSPFIPYELGKYLLFLLLMFGILKGYKKGIIGWLMFLLLLPGVLIDEAGQTTFKNIVFNLIGPLNVALAVVFFKNQEINDNDFVDIMRLLLYPLISVLFFTIIKTPKLETIEFMLGSNFETSGGFGSNQVSTALGLGAFIIFIFWFNRWKLTGYRWLDMIMMIVFLFRGLLTFSRGGMIGGILAIFIIFLFKQRTDYIETSSGYFKKFIKLIPVLFLLFLTFRYADNITKGQLFLRYKGETPGTLRGSKALNLNVFTSNRLDIFKDDLRLWAYFPLLGTGVGASSYLRNTAEKFLSHIELSRLLAEHGILGLIYSIILVILGFDIYRRQKFRKYGEILSALFVIAAFTTFHSAMRTYISPLLIGISMLNLVSDPDYSDYFETSEADFDSENPVTPTK